MQRTLSIRTQADMMDDLATMLEAGIPIREVVDELGRCYPGRPADAVRRMTQTLARGGDLSDGMRDFFSPVICDAVRAGLKCGRLTISLSLATGIMRARASAIGKFIGSMIYPVAIFVLSIVGIASMSVYVLPELGKLVPANKWTPLGRSVMAAGMFITTFGPFLLLALFAAFGWAGWSLSKLTGPLRESLDRLPPWSLYRKYQAASFMMNLSLLLAADVKIKEALTHLAQRASPYVSWHLRAMLRRLSAPEGGVTHALDTGLIDDRDIRRLRLMEQASDFDRALATMGQRAGDQVNKVIEIAGKILFVVVLLSTGGLIAFMVLGLFQVLGSLA